MEEQELKIIEEDDSEAFKDFQLEEIDDARKRRDDKVIADFIEAFSLNYEDKPEGEPNYSPRKHSNNCSSFKQNGFFVYYAFPNGSQTPVASFWTQYVNDYGNEKFSFVHIDLKKVIDKVIDYYEMRGHYPPSQRT